MVERDLPKVDVEGSKPFSRSKIEEALSGLFYFIFGMGFEPEKRVRQNPVMHEVRKTDFELDTSTARASPKGLIATLRQQGILRLNNPFSRSKKQKDQVKDLVFCFWREGFLRTLEEGSTKFFCGRKPVKRI